MSQKDPWQVRHTPASGRKIRRSVSGGKRRLLWWLAAVGGLILLLNWLFPGVSIDSAGEVLAVATLVVIGSVVILSLRMHYRDFFRYVALWSAIILVLSVAYAFRHDIAAIADRVAGSAISARGYVQEDASGQAMVFERGMDGHFHIRAKIKGMNVHFLVDTGASNVILTRKDAQRLGILPPKDQYFERYYTANGVVMAAPVMLDRVSIGDHITVENVRASVTEGELHVSLLGMSFLKQLGRFEMTGETLTIRQ